MEDWGLEDPSGKGTDAFRETRELIKDKVIKLIKDIEEGRIF
jgi:arsenate reductase